MIHQTRNILFVLFLPIMIGHAQFSFAAENQLPFEKPAIYTLPEVLKLTETKNYSSRIEFEHVMQAKRTAKAAQLHLIPHLSFSSILSNTSPTFLSIIGAAGDLLPFLFPTRWIQTKNAKLRSKVESETLTLMQEDASSLVEILAYAYRRDSEVLFAYDTLINRAYGALEASDLIEKKKQFPEGSTDHLKATIQFMEADFAALEELRKEDLLALSQAVGFHNPEAISELQFTEESLPIERAVILNSKPVSDVAVEMALELKQIDELVQIGRNQRKATYFSWLDPAGDYMSNLGFGLMDTVAVASSQIAELELKREQMQIGLVQNVYVAVAQYNQAIDQYPAVLEMAKLSEIRLNRVIFQLTPNSNLNTLDIQAVFQDYISTEVRKANLLASFRTARARINRAVLADVYETNAFKN